MNVAVIYAHPNPNSFNAAILGQVTRGLTDGGHTCTVIDLYQEQFDPALFYDGTHRRSQLKDDPETKKYRDIVTAAEHLILIYPLWWSGPPAILKGFLDRVFVSGYAYQYEGLVPRGLLQGKSAWVYYTSDSPTWYLRFFRRDADWIVMRNATLRFCGLHPVRRFQFAQAKRSTEARRTRWLERVYKQVKFGLS